MSVQVYVVTYRSKARTVLNVVSIEFGSIGRSIDQSSKCFDLGFLFFVFDVDRLPDRIANFQLLSR
jgi:hypothetical protein